MNYNIDIKCSVHTTPTTTAVADELEYRYKKFETHAIKVDDVSSIEKSKMSLIF